MLKDIKILSETYDEWDEYNWKGYRYIIEVETYNNSEKIEKPFLYLEPYTVITLNDLYDDGAQSTGIRIKPN